MIVPLEKKLVNKLVENTVGVAKANSILAILATLSYFGCIMYHVFGHMFFFFGLCCIQTQSLPTKYISALLNSEGLVSAVSTLF